jgi:hypothetical protein
MTNRQKILQLNIECVNSNKNKFESIYDFKFRNQDLTNCRFVNTIRIFSEEDLDIIEFGNVLANLKQLNVIEKHFQFSPYFAGENLFTIHM